MTRASAATAIFLSIGLCLANGCGGGGGSSSPTSPGSTVDSSLPNITSFLANPSTTFVMDANGLAQLYAARPFMGSASGCYNNNLTLYPLPKDAPYTIDMYAPADGIISKVDTCVTPSPGVTDQYGVGMNIASYNGRNVQLYMSGEPALHSDGFGVTTAQAYPCSGKVPGQDNGFFKPYIFVSEGQHVTAGQRIMQLYVYPFSYYGDAKTANNPKVAHSTSDIYLSKQSDNGALACPNIFSSAIEAQVSKLYSNAQNMGFSCNGAPYPVAICNLPAGTENIVGR